MITIFYRQQFIYFEIRMRILQLILVMIIIPVSINKWLLYYDAFYNYYLIFIVNCSRIITYLI